MHLGLDTALAKAVTVVINTSPVPTNLQQISNWITASILQVWKRHRRHESGAHSVGMPSEAETQDSTRLKDGSTDHEHKTFADPETRPSQLTIFYTPLTELGGTSLLQTGCLKVYLRLTHTCLVPFLSTGNVTFALCTVKQLTLHPPQLSCLCWYEKEQALKVQENFPPALKCPI